MKKKQIQEKVDGWAPIHLAASAGKKMLVVSLARQGADVNMLYKI